MDDLAVARHACALDDFVLPIELRLTGLLVDEETDEIEEVAAIEVGRVDREFARQIGGPMIVTPGR